MSNSKSVFSRSVSQKLISLLQFYIIIRTYTGSDVATQNFTILTI